MATRCLRPAGTPGSQAGSSDSPQEGAAVAEGLGLRRPRLVLLPRARLALPGRPGPGQCGARGAEPRPHFTDGETVPLAGTRGRTGVAEPGLAPGPVGLGHAGEDPEGGGVRVRVWLRPGTRWEGAPIPLGRPPSPPSPRKRSPSPVQPASRVTFPVAWSWGRERESLGGGDASCVPSPIPHTRPR